MNWFSRLGLIVCFAFSLESFAAMPGLQDYWRFDCAPQGYRKSAMAKAKSKAKRSNLDGAINSFLWACLQSARELTALSKARETWQEKGAKGNAPQLNNAQSTALLNEATARLRAQYNRNKKDSRATFYHAFSLALKGDDWAVNRFDDVISKLGSEKYAQRSNFILGEYFFEKAGMGQAAPYYKKAMVGKDKFIQLYVRYKTAWVDYGTGAQTKNRKLQRKAINQLARLFNETKRGSGKFSALSERIKTDVIDLAADFGDIAQARKLLRSVGAADLFSSILQSVASTKAGSGDYKGAYNLLAMALKESPTSSDAPAIHTSMVAISFELKNPAAVVANLKRMHKMYVAKKSPWRRANKKKKLVKTTVAQVESLTFDYGTGFDRQGRDMQDMAQLKHALTLYDLLLKSFPKSKRVEEVSFYRSQLLFVMNRYQDAAIACLELIKANPKSKYAKDSLEVMVTAAQGAIDADKTDYKLGEPGSLEEKLPIPKIKQVYADSLDTFVKYLPRNPNSPAMAYAAASVYYDFGHYNEGNERYNKFIKKYSSNDFAKTAAARLIEYEKFWGTDKSRKKLKRRLGKISALRRAPEFASYFAKTKAKKRRSRGDEGDAGEVETVNESADNSQEEALEEATPTN